MTQTRRTNRRGDDASNVFSLLRRGLALMCVGRARRSPVPGLQARGKQWGNSYSTRDWDRFYHYPYVYYPQTSGGILQKLRWPVLSLSARNAGAGVRQAVDELLSGRTVVPHGAPLPAGYVLKRQRQRNCARDDRIFDKANTVDRTEWLGASPRAWTSPIGCENQHRCFSAVAGGSTRNAVEPPVRGLELANSKPLLSLIGGKAVLICLREAAGSKTVQRFAGCLQARRGRAIRRPCAPDRSSRARTRPRGTPAPEMVAASVPKGTPTFLHGPAALFDNRPQPHRPAARWLHRRVEPIM